MAAAPSEFTRFVLEQLAPLGPLRVGRFFGGTGIAWGDTQFAMVIRDTLYLVVDERSRPRFEAAGMGPFAYQTRQRQVQVRRYFALPEAVLDDPPQLREWAQEAISAAVRTRPAGSKPAASRPKARPKA